MKQYGAWGTNLNTGQRIENASSMAMLLWRIMMLLVLVTVVFMWFFQIYFMERNYVASNIAEVQQQIDAVLGNLETADLANNERLLASLSCAASGKLLMIDGDGQLIAVYNRGGMINLDEGVSDITVWEQIVNGKEYSAICAGETYSLHRTSGKKIDSYEYGVPVRYHGQDAYLVLYHAFGELYSVLEMNRRQLVLLSIVLTFAAAFLAAFLAKRFTGPILTIKKTVDQLTQGKLAAVCGLERGDEIGQLAKSVEELGTALQRVDVLRKEVIANVSHELRSPLFLIRGYAEMVRDITWTDDAQRNEDLNLIIGEANRMSEMVSDIMDYSQLQAGYLQLKIDEYDLCEIVEMEVRHCDQSAQDNHLILHLERPPRELCIRADALKLGQVLRNLLYNAINHTQDGSTIRISIQETSAGYQVSVINPGEAIPEEEQSIIWERYQRSQHQGGRRQGTGIGLSIVKTILDAHGMSYGVDCSTGDICFWFCCRAEA